MKEQEILVKETTEELNTYLPKMINGIENFVEYVMQSKEQDAQKLLPVIFEGLEWIAQAIYLKNRIKQGTMKEQELVEKLPLLIDAYENRDFILISDILDYEIKPILEKWIHRIH
ncbi:hypothetical protein [Crassaminicella indica]|uniref:DUF8042 domain-containing protein n=1 Tax=Crassaminicella indica TaxID=2855394 RepID=A0ABX8R818_9CLOT|nr:hypothetical protein [Crassaminicella indica]QXM05173.1 hypothetical protein KVH43_07145 [Crassaminicella indica]